MFREDRACWIAAVTCLAAVFLGALLVRPSLFEGADYVHLHEVNRLYARAALLQGRLPTWNPHVGLGRPFLADVETAVWYPPNLVFLLLPVRAAVAAVLLGHAALALWGMALLGRQMGMGAGAAAVAALGYAGGGVFASRLLLGQVPFVEGLCYLPLLLFLTLRLLERPSLRRVAILAAAIALQLLAGHPQVAWVTWVGLAFFVVGRHAGTRGHVGPLMRGLALLAGALLLAATLAAVQLLPTAELAREGNRAGRSLEFAAEGALSLRNLLTLFVAPGPGWPANWEADLYCGGLAVLAGLAGLTRWREPDVSGLALSALACGLLSLGDRTPLFALAYAVVPGLASFHIHSRLAVWTVFALCALGGVFLSRTPVATAPAGPRPGRQRAALVVAGVVLAAAAAARGILSTAPPRVLGSLAVAVGALALWRHRRSAPLATVLVVFVAGADLLSASLDLKTAFPPMARAFPGPFPGEQVATAALRAAGLLRAGEAPPRTSLPDTYARPNSGMLYGFSTFTGYVALSLRRVWTYEHRRLDIPVPGTVNTFPSPLIFHRAAFPFACMNLSAGLEPGTWRLVVRGDPDPRAYLVAATVRVADWEEAIELLRRGHDPHAAALVESPALEITGNRGARAGAADDPPASVRIVAFGPETVVARVASPRGGLLVLAETWYPGWRAWVDGRETPCGPANVWARAAVVPVGDHEVRFEYRSRTLRAGAVVSALGAIAATVAIARPRPRKKSPDDAGRRG
jgi:hypothetical protein